MRLFAGIGDDVEQCLDPISADRCDDAKFCKMRADRIDDCSLLPNEQVPRAMEHQAALLLGRLDRHEPHVGPGHCLTDCLGISGIILVPLYVRLDIGWRHQAHGMPKRLQLPRPMVR